MAESSSLVPSFSVEIEPSRLGAEDASARLDAFAAEHGVGAGVRGRLAAVTAEVVGGLADAGHGSGRIMVEADVGPDDFQIVFTHDLGSRQAVDETRTRLAGVGASCDGFSAERTDRTGLEVWVRFARSPAGD
jgi:hypothetical protein